MRFPSLSLCLILAGFALPATAVAQDDAAAEEERILEQHADDREAPAPDEDEPEELPAIYSALGVQKLSAGFANVSDAINLDITAIGFRIPTVPWFGVELNISSTFIPGEVQGSSSSPGSEECVLPPFVLCSSTGGTQFSTDEEYGLNSLGIFMVGRSPGTFFATGKLGYRYLDTNLFEVREKTGNAWALGAGYRWKDDGSYVELLYTKLSEDFDAIGFSISYSYDRYW